MPEDCPKNLFWTQTSFLAVSEIWAGIAVSGCLCFGKNTFEPFHLAQIFLSAVYVAITAFLMLLIYTEIGIMGALAADLSALFVVFSLTILLGVANFHSKSPKRR
ncbi:MAG: hypothetical protein IJI37_01830 [Opitutales bacterium]|nr:hypothetical protein [Opitutales bacterium]